MVISHEPYVDTFRVYIGSHLMVLERGELETLQKLIASALKK